MKGFRYQITAAVLLKKYKHNGEIEFKPVYFSSVTKTVTNHMFRLEKSFEEILYAIDVWINNGSGWIIELLSLNTLIFQLIDHYQEVLIWIYLLN